MSDIKETQHWLVELQAKNERLQAELDACIKSHQRKLNVLLVEAEQATEAAEARAEKAEADNVALREGIRQSKLLSRHQSKAQLLDDLLAVPNPGEKILAVVEAARVETDAEDRLASTPYSAGSVGHEFIQAQLDSWTEKRREAVRALDAEKGEDMVVLRSDRLNSIARRVLKALEPSL